MDASGGPRRGEERRRGTRITARIHIVRVAVCHCDGERYDDGSVGIPSQELIMRVQLGKLIALGYGRFVLSDEVVAVQPVEEGRGPGRRAFVWVRDLKEPIVASRSEEAIVRDLTTPADDAMRLRQQRAVLQQVVKTLDAVPPLLRRVLREEDGVDLEALADDVRKVLG
jgi:hypothetical protein